MRSVGRPVVISVAALVTGVAAWAGGQCVLAAAHGRESAAVLAQIQIRIAADTAGRGIDAQHIPSADTGASYWWPIVLANTVQLAALAALGLLLVIAGRRRSWAGLGLLAVVRPDLVESPLRWLSPIGYGWWGSWVRGGTVVGEPSPGLPVLPYAGAVVDLLVMALPAVVYLLLTRHAPRPDVVPIRRVLSRLVVPYLLIGGGLALYGLVDVDGQPHERVVAALLVVTAAGLLAATRLGPVIAVMCVSVVAGLASPEVSGVLSDLAAGSGAGRFWMTVTGNATPLFVVAVVGAVCAAHGPALASSYRRLVRRPAAAPA